MEERPYRTVWLDPDFRRGPQTDVFCCVCQKDIATEPKHYARLVEGGFFAVHPEDVGMIPAGDPDDLGTHPVGSDCARGIGREWFSAGPAPVSRL